MKGASISRPPAHRITIAQTAILLASWAALSFWDALAGNSFVLGGLVVIVPNAWFALGVFRWRGANVARQAVKAGYAAETGKFLPDARVPGVALAEKWLPRCVFPFVRSRPASSRQI